MTAAAASSRVPAVELLEGALVAAGCKPRNGHARCPVHGGNDVDSLSYRAGDDGRALVCCHSKGCSFSSIAAALGLTVGDLMPDKANGGRASEVAAYPYRDPAGELLFEVVRFVPKNFRQRRPDGNGGHVWGLSEGTYERRPGAPEWYRVKDKPRPGAETRDFPGCRKVLFRLPETLAAVQAGRSIFIAEGEKDVATLVAWGLDATCNPGGAGKWHSDYCEALRGAHVVVLPDDDDVGRKHGEAVAASLRGVAADIKVLELPGAKDVSEWAEAGGTREALEALVTAPTTESEPRPRLLVYTAAELLTLKLPPREAVLVDRTTHAAFLRERDLGMIYATRGVGKTRCAHGLAVALAGGGQFLAWDAPSPQPVLMVDGELELVDFQAILANTIRALGVEPSLLRVLAAQVQPDGLGSLTNPDVQHRIEDEIRDAKFITLDNISTLCVGGEENSQESWQPVQSWLLSLRRAGVGAMLVHHAGRSGNARGTTGREDVLDLIVKLDHPEDYSAVQGCRFRLSVEKARGVFGAAVQPIEAAFEYGPHGAPVWTWRTIDALLKARILELHRDSLSVSAIARELGCSKSHVSRTVRQGADHE